MSDVLTRLGLDHEPRPEPRYHCGTCGRGLIQDPTAPSGWAHQPTYYDQHQMAKARNRQSARERTMAAPRYVGPTTECRAMSYGERLGWRPCGNKAGRLREGKPVCGAHVRSETVYWRVPVPRAQPARPEPPNARGT